MNMAPWLALFIPFLFLRLLFQHFHCRRYNLPPGPKPWPIIGNLNLIGPIPHHSLHQLSQKYGPIMHLTLGLKHVVVVSSADGAKAFLKTHGKTFSSRPKATAGKYTTYDYSDMLWAPYGPHWRQARKMYFTQLLFGKSIGSNEYIRKEEMKNMLNELFISSGKPLLPKDYKSHGSGEEVRGEGLEWLYLMGRVQGPGARVFLAQHILEYWGSDPLAQFLGLAGLHKENEGF